MKINDTEMKAFTFIYQREYFNRSRQFGAERMKKIKAKNINEACDKMLKHMGQWFNIGCKEYVYDESGKEISLSDIKSIQHMLLPH